MTPPKLKAKEFEQLILDAGKRSKQMHVVRYGVSASLMNSQWRPISSLPDFEGVTSAGKQFIIEAKCWSQSSFQLGVKLIKPRQIMHMLERSIYGVPCYLMIHWNERILKTKTDPAFTVAVPVCRMFERLKALATTKVDQGSISRPESKDLGEIVNWSAPKGCRKCLPDLEQLLGISPPQPRQEVLL